MSRIQTARAACIAALATLGAADSRETSPGSRDPGRLRLDLERHVERVLSLDPKTGLPRMETTVEVKAQTPEALLARFLKPGDIRGGPPLLPSPAPAGSVNLVPLIQALWKAARHDSRTFYLYRMTTPQGRSAVLRDSPLPRAALIAPGAVYELVDTYHDPDQALAAWRGLEEQARAEASQPCPDAASPSAGCGSIPPRR